MLEMLGVDEWVPLLVLSPFLGAFVYLGYVVWQDYRRRQRPASPISQRRTAEDTLPKTIPVKRSAEEG